MRKQKRQGMHVAAGEAAPRLGPLSYCHYAVEYLDAARAASTKRKRFKPAQTHLACHAIELALIAYLSLQAAPNSPTGHGVRTPDLWHLLEMAESHGLVELARLTSAQRGQIMKAAQYYSEQVFEYPALTEVMRGYPEAPDIRALLDAASVLVAAARRAVGADFLRTPKRTTRR
jgi:hypothetical protein